MGCLSCYRTAKSGFKEQTDRQATSFTAEDITEFKHTGRVPRRGRTEEQMDERQVSLIHVHSI